MWFLHAWNDPGRPRTASYESESQRSADPPWPGRQYVPVHRLPEHRPCGPRGRRYHGEHTMSTRVFGSGIRRREDPRLITGAASYTDDFALPGMVHLVMLRSPHAHARIKRIDT